MNRGRVMLREVVCEESGGIKPFDLHQPVPVDLVQRHVRNRFDVIEYAELQGHRVTPVGDRNTKLL